MSLGAKPNFTSYPNAFIFPKKCLLELKHLFCHGVYFLLHTLILLQRKRGREVMKEQKETREGVRGGKQNKKKAGLTTVKGKACEEQEKQELLAERKDDTQRLGDRTPGGSPL